MTMSVSVGLLQGNDPKATEAVRLAASATTAARSRGDDDMPPAVPPLVGAASFNRAAPVIAARKRMGIRTVVYWKAMLVAGG